MNKIRAFSRTIANGLKHVLSVLLSHPSWSGIGSLATVLSLFLILYQNDETQNIEIASTIDRSIKEEHWEKNKKPSFSTQRIALVVANASYPNAPLDNPINDATAIIEQLKKRGFRVIKKIDASRDELLHSIEHFQTLLSLGGVGLFYYAGNGLHVNGNDYIIPIDQLIYSEDEIFSKGINFTELLRPVDNIIMDSPSKNGVVIIYASGKDQVSIDGLLGSTHSPFTESVLEGIEKEELEIFDFYRFVSKAVSEKTSGQQVPWVSASTDVQFYFNKPDKDVDIGILKILLFDSCRYNPFSR